MDPAQPKGKSPFVRIAHTLTSSGILRDAGLLPQHVQRDFRDDDHVHDTP